MKKSVDTQVPLTISGVIINHQPQVSISSCPVAHGYAQSPDQVGVLYSYLLYCHMPFLAIGYS